MNKISRYINKNISKLNESKKVISFKVGDTIRVSNLIIESGKKRIQFFEGLCIAFFNRNIASSFKIKKISKAMVFEKTFPLYSPFVQTIEIVKRGLVKKSKLYYIRSLIGKAARIKREKTFYKN